MSTQAFINIQNSKHWDEQVSYLKQMEVTQATARLMNCPKNATVVKQLLCNSRTKVITCTALFLIELFQKYGPLLHSFALNLMGTDILFKLLNSSNKVIFSSAHQLLKTILINCPHSKFYPILVTQFNSKNPFLRECISSYFLVLADTIEFPNNFISIVRNWKCDANKEVRDNMAKLEQIITIQMNKQTKNPKRIKNGKILKQNKQNTPYFAKPRDKQKMSGIGQNSQMIIQSFVSHEQSGVDQIENIQFLISKIESDDGWNMKQFAIQELCSICEVNMIEPNKFNKIVPVLVKLLDQRRSKTSMKVSNALRDIIDLNQEQFSNYLSSNFCYFAQKAVKNQQNGAMIICRALDIDPSKYLVQLSQLTVEIKSLRQKVVLLDVLVQKICKHSLPFSRASIIMKLICKHIEKYHTNKEIYLPCMAILSHFKVSFPDEFLGCLLCLQKQILNKIMLIAEQIDPQLRDGIVSYIHSLKGTEKKDKKCQKIDRMQNNELSELLNIIIEENEEDAVSKLAEHIFEMKQKISVHQYYEIIKLTQRVTSQNSLLELELLLQQICKTNSNKFLEALFEAIASCDASTIQAEYIIAYLRKIYTIFSTCPWLMSPKHTLKLITAYRYSKCPKVRLFYIKTLALFPNQIMASNVNSKQKELIKSQRKSEPTEDFLK